MFLEAFSGSKHPMNECGYVKLSVMAFVTKS